MTQKKNKFWTLCFSLIPGAAEMYMGFMKMGLSLMTIFMLIFTVAVTIEFGPLIFIGIIAWFYSFFHAHNLSSLPDEDFYALEDDYLIHFTNEYKTGEDFIRAYKKPIAYTLLFFGVFYTWQAMTHLLYSIIPDYLYGLISTYTNNLPKLVVGMAIIFIGALMIRGKKKELDEEDTTDGKYDDSKGDQ